VASQAQQDRPSCWPRLGFGLGLRAEHYRDVLADPGPVAWFEAITENYMDSHGRPLAVLERVRAERPVALHGVALSIGSADPLDRGYLGRLRALINRIEPALVTDHLCWTGVDRRSLYDLLPLPYTEEILDYVAARVLAVQEALGCRIAVENPSRYLEFSRSTMPEWEFLAALAEQADCGILLDVNNVYVTGRNTGFDPERYLDALPVGSIAQIHLAGFSDCGTHLFDTHSAPVHPDVWRLYERAIERFGPVSTMVEWDAEIPSYERLCVELETARVVAECASTRMGCGPCDGPAPVGERNLHAAA
jgi:uncharacterized protein (UPF0276 family)